MITYFATAPHQQVLIGLALLIGVSALGCGAGEPLSKNDKGQLPAEGRSQGVDEAAYARAYSKSKQNNEPPVPINQNTQTPQRPELNADQQGPAPKAGPSFQLVGHQGAVTYLALSGDGTLLISGGADGTSRLWDLKAQREVLVAKQRCEGKVTGVAFSGDGRLAYSSGEDKLIREWDTKTGEQIRTFAGHEGPVTAFRLKIDKGYMVSADSEGNLWRWNMSTGKHEPFNPTASPPKPAAKLAPLVNDTQVLYTTPDGEVVLFSSAADAAAEPQKLHAPATSVILAPNGNYAAGLEDGALAFWLWDGKQHVRVDRARSGPAADRLAFMTANQGVLVLDRAGKFERWQMEPPQLYAIEETKVDEFTCSTFGQEQMVYGRSDGAIGVCRPGPVKFLFNDPHQAYLEGVSESLRRNEIDILEFLAAKYRNDREPSPWGDAKLHSLYEGLAINKGGGLLGGASTKANREKWLADRPESKTALLANARALIVEAWQARGFGFAGGVTEDGARQFHGGLKKAEALLAQADKLPEVDPDQFYQQIEVAKGLGTPREEPDKTIAKLMQEAPWYSHGYVTMAEYLLPRWHGEPGELESFAAKVADKIGGDAGAEIYAYIVCRMARYNAAYELFQIHDFDYERMKKGFASLGNKPVPRMMNEACFFAVLKQDHDSARKFFGLVDEKGTPPPTWLWGRGERFQHWKAWALSEHKPSKAKLVFFAHWSAARKLWFSSDSKNVFSFGLATPMKIWNPETGERIGVVNPTPGFELVYAEMSGDRTLMATAEMGVQSRIPGPLSIHDLTGMTPPQRLDGVEGQILCLAISPDKKQIAATQHEKGVYVWNWEEPQKPRMMDVVKDWSPTTLVFSPDGKSLYGAGGMQLSCWDMETSKVRSWPLGSSHDVRRGMLFTKDGEELIVGGDQLQTNWHLRRNTATDIKPPMALGIFSLSPAKDLLADGDEAGVVRLWDLKTKRLLESFSGHTGRIFMTDFSPDGKTLASCSYDGTIRLWDVSKYEK